jgi:hypothetical protein
VGLKLNCSHQLLAEVDNENLIGDDIVTIKKNTLYLIHAIKGMGLEINAEKNKYMLLSRHQNVGRNHGMKVKLFRYLETTVTN